ncbi:SCP-like protein [Ancylostoma caninum]|uniref:SCP-like protein n=1 Tax=Ancylostoma caninum TaxID=29170 RepID=A0A368GLQ7_ANCCA|nr:SCP-like protein [Ancylostoma caninum]
MKKIIVRMPPNSPVKFVTQSVVEINGMEIFSSDVPEYSCIFTTDIRIKWLPKLVDSIKSNALVSCDYQCWNFKSTDEIRELYLKQANALREQIAQGTADCKDSKKCPQGKNIYKLFWDCMLEMEAQKAVDKCTDTASPLPDATIIIKKQSLTTCNPKPLFKETVKGWWDVVKTVGLDDIPINKAGLETFTALANGRATRIGCAQKNCNGDLYLACVTFQKAPETNQPIYEVGTGCATNADCTTFAGSKCKAARKVCQTQICPNNAHITTDEIRNIFLNLHNQHRSNLARGLVRNGNTQAFARQASKMIKLTYSCTAETSAFAWARQCQDRDSNTGGVSENRYTFPNKNLDMTVVARRASNRWFEEITTKGMSQADLNRYYARLGVSHYARMAWDSTRSFGCAIYKCPNFINAVCHYNGGGAEGGQIYKMGPACNRCSTIGATRCEQGLCVF